MSDHTKDFTDFYITGVQPCPYLPGERERKVFTHLNRGKTPEIVDHLLRNGFRRSQNIAYSPCCDHCDACHSVRVLVREFEPGRTMRRTLDLNRDLVVRRIGSRPSAEQYALFRTYVDGRHGEGGMTDMSMRDYFMMVEDSVVETGLTEYRLRPEGSPPGELQRWPLVGTTLTDRLSDGISMVYSFFDPAHSERSLGTYMILEHIAHVRALGLEHLYLGYWIERSRKMAYKARFLPQEMLTQRGWIRRAQVEK